MAAAAAAPSTDHPAMDSLPEDPTPAPRTDQAPDATSLKGFFSKGAVSPGATSPGGVGQPAAARWRAVSPDEPRQPLISKMVAKEFSPPDKPPAAELPPENECRPPKSRRIEEITTDIRPSLDPQLKAKGIAVPPDCPTKIATYQPRAWCPVTFTWTASATCNKPLYFDDVQLENYGHSWGPYVQPLVSGVHFFATIPLLPYKMAIDPPGECVYTLGYYRPGSCAPYQLDPFPLSVRAALVEAGFWTGLPFVF